MDLNHSIKPPLFLKYGRSDRINPVGKIALLQTFFVNSALKIQCHVVKNTLLQTVS